MSARRWLLVTALVVLCAASFARAADAQPAPSRVSSPVTDEAGVLSPAEEARVERVLRAGQQRGVDLYVLFVDDTGGRQATAYAQDVARESSMGGNDALLMVAFGDRSFGLWVGEGLRVDSAEVNAILDRLVAPRLRADDVPGSVEAAVQGILRADGTGTRTVSRPRGGGFSLLPLLLFGLIFLFAASRFFSRFRGGGRQVEWEQAPGPQVDVQALAAEANAALLRVDDHLQDVEHESGFAEAQFGAAQGAELRQDLERARAELREAFEIRQRLDDHVPEPPEEQVAMLEEILARTGRAEAVATQGMHRLEELRGLERDPASAIADLRARREALAHRGPAAAAAVAELRASAPSLVVAVDGNVTEAEKRLAFVDERLQEATGAAAPEAAQALRAAGAALAQAEQLLSATEDLATRVRQARTALPQELQEAELALARAEDLVRSRRHFVGRAARTRVVEARRRYERARELSGQDPTAAATEADVAERLADEAFELALRDIDSDDDAGYGGGGGIQSFGWGLPVPIPLPFPIGGSIGWGGTSWGGRGGFGGAVGGGSFGGGFGGGSVGGGRW